MKMTRGDLLERYEAGEQDFGGVDFSGANLKGVFSEIVDFTGSGNYRRLRFRGAVFHGADLSRAMLCGHDFRGADFRRADLRGVEFGNSDLSGADLSGADLREVDFCAADLCGVIIDKSQSEQLAVAVGAAVFDSVE